MKISDLLDKKISKIRFNHIFENKDGQQGFQSQIKLSNGQFVLLPKSPDDTIDLIEQYASNNTLPFHEAKRCGLTSRLLFKNKQIIDIHFKYMDDEPISDSSAILELDNGKFITENNATQNDLTNINLQIMNKAQFRALTHDGIELRSLRKNMA